MDAEDILRKLRRDLEEKKRSAMARLVAAAADSTDAAVRAACAEYRTFDDILKELTRKKDE